MIDLQKMMDALSESARLSRANYHLTLGQAIELAKAADPQMVVEFDRGGSPAGPHSYRGYYSDLSFGQSGAPVTVAEFLSDLTKSLGRTFEGYKGGDYVMGDETPLWVAPYGCTGPAIMGARINGEKLILETREID
jgi:hypothetical protein